MLSVYTRHYPPCRESDCNYGDAVVRSGSMARCRQAILFAFPQRQEVRKQRKKSDCRNRTRIHLGPGTHPIELHRHFPKHSKRCSRAATVSQETSRGVTIKEAVEQFLRDEQARGLAKTTTAQRKTLFEKQLLKWARTSFLTWLDELTTARLRDFRALRKNNPLTTQRKHNRLNGFFEFLLKTMVRQEPVQEDETG
jgi:hypothetical protein